VVDGYRKQFGCYIRSIVGQLRIVDIFDIVTDFPESADAVADLQECMRHCSLQKRLVRSYCQACASRLHIPGTFLFPPRLHMTVLPHYLSDESGLRISLNIAHIRPAVSSLWLSR